MIALAINPCIAADLPSLGDPPPAIALPNLAGKTVELSDLSGKNTIITFFASWSKSCSEMIKALDDLKKEIGPQLDVYAISFDKKASTLEKYIEENKLDLNFLIDKKLKTINEYAILIIPTTICVNKEGKIEKIFVDYDDNVKQALSDWLATRSEGQ